MVIVIRVIILGDHGGSRGFKGHSPLAKMIGAFGSTAPYESKLFGYISLIYLLSTRLANSLKQCPNPNMCKNELQIPLESLIFDLTLHY